MPSPALPLDLLHIIASDLAAHFPRGPPSTVIATFSLSKRLLPVINASLLSGIFHLQFDTRAIHARIPNVTATALAHELKRRWRCLKRIRWAARAGPAVWGNSYSEADIIEDMWTSYLLILENDGKNWDQLVGWAMLPAYVQAYVQWDLYPAAASDDLPQETEFRSLGLWLLWFLSDNQNSLREIDRHPKLKRLLSPIVFSSYAYATTHLPWYQFTPPADPLAFPLPHPRPTSPQPSFPRISSFTTYISHPIHISPPFMAEAAHRLYFATLAPPRPIHSSPSDVSPPRPSWNSPHYDLEWRRLFAFCPPFTRSMPHSQDVYVPGSLAGEFEGTFVLPDPNLFDSIRNGAPPLPLFQSSFLFPSTEAWRFQEYVYVDSPRRRDKTEIYVPGSIAPRRLTSHRPLPPGPPLGAHLPRVVRLERVRGGLLATTDQAAVLYEDVKEPAETFRPESLSDELPIGGDPSCVEIIVTGQAIEPNGGMAVGVMRAGAIASGTIRRSDGLITLFARSDNGGGRWLYIGRLSADGSFNGRCRALQDDSTSIVWESVFHMRRRA